VLLGVTPELATLDWPADTSLLAIDKSEAMIQSVWPSWGVPPRAAVRCADWLAMPLDDASVDLVVGDGVYSALVHRDYAALTAQVRRVLRPAGLFVARAFVAPPEREPVRHVADELRSARIGSFHAFKWRLAMALQASLAEGVCVGDVWRVWSDLCPDREALAAKLGWELATIASIDAYRGAATRYTFPTREELRAELASAFDERACHVPGYELGERCPSLVLTAR
jgi:SAM-dependent methyltransferase